MFLFRIGNFMEALVKVRENSKLLPKPDKLASVFRYSTCQLVSIFRK